MRKDADIHRMSCLVQDAQPCCVDIPNFISKYKGTNTFRVCAHLRRPSHILPEKAMAPHSSTLAWKIPWMEEPGGLQSMGSLRVGHD